MDIKENPFPTRFDPKDIKESDRFLREDFGKVEIYTQKRYNKFVSDLCRLGFKVEEIFMNGSPIPSVVLKIEDFNTIKNKITIPINTRLYDNGKIIIYPK